MWSARRGPFVGREREVAALRAGLAAAAEGRGGVLFLAGEPGIGKTRTVEEFARIARAARAEVLIGRCYESGGAPAFWPWVQVLRSLVRVRSPAALRALIEDDAPAVAHLLPQLRRLFPEIASFEAADSPEARFRLFDGVARVLARASADSPLVVVLDDLHEGDEPSLLLLEFIARVLDGTQLLLVGTHRSRATPQGRLATTLRELRRAPNVEQLALPGLDLDAVRLLAAARPGRPVSEALIARLHERTEGNPLFLSEFLRALPESADVEHGSAGVRVPELVRDVIGWHLAPLTPECGATLRAAAVLGREFVLDVLAEVAGQPREVLLRALDEASAAGILIESADRHRFAHALFAEVLYSHAPAEERLRLHERAGAALAARADSAEQLARIAHHYLQSARLGGRSEEAIDYSRRAGDRALELLAFEEAERHYALALDVLSRARHDATRERVELLLALGSARTRQGDVERAREAFLRAAEAARVLPDPDLLARAALGCGGEIGVPDSGHQDGVHGALLDEALVAVGPGDSPARARLLVQRAIHLFFSDAREQRHGLCAEALAMARRLGDEGTVDYALLGTHAATWGPDNPRERLAICDELIERTRRSDDRRLRARAHAWRFCDLLELGDGAAIAEFETFRSLAGDLREPSLRGQAVAFQVTVATLAGRFEEAEALITQLASGSQWLGRAAEVTLATLRSALRMAQGRFGELVEPVRTVVARNPAIAGMRCGLAYVCARAGHDDEARRELETFGADTILGMPRDTSFLPGLCQLGEAFALLGERERCGVVYDRVIPYAAWSLTIGKRAAYLGTVSHYLGVMAAALGRREEAAGFFEHALEAQARMGARPWLALSQVAYAELLLADGDAAWADRGRELVREARQAATALGIQGLAARIERLLSVDSRCQGAERAGDIEALWVPPRVPGKGSAAIFRREGDFWTLSYADREVRLRDLRGLHYLSQLLRHPGREIHACEVVGVANRRPATTPFPCDGLGTAAGLGDAGERVDARARAAYRERLRELSEELAKAESRSDLGRIARLRAEQEALLVEVACSVKGRRVASHAERARLAATKGIGAAIGRIVASHPELGAHLAATVRRGYFCAYVPDPRYPIEWEL